MTSERKEVRVSMELFTHAEHSIYHFVVYRLLPPATVDVLRVDKLGQSSTMDTVRIEVYHMPALSQI